MIGNRKESSFALEPESIIEFGEKQVGEDAGSIKDEGNLDMKLNIIHENAEDREDNKSDCKVTLVVAVAELEMSTPTRGEHEEEREMVKGDSVDFQTEQECKENEPGLMCVVATSSKQSASYESKEMGKADYQNGQEDKEYETVLTCDAATSGGQSGTNEDVEMVTGDFPGSQAGQESRVNEPGLVSAVATSGEESGTIDGGTKDTAC